MQKQPTKAQKRRQHQAEREAEREAELDAERAEQGESEKTVEDRELKEMLTPLGLTVRFIQVCDSSLSLASLFVLHLDRSLGSALKLQTASTCCSRSSLAYVACLSQFLESPMMIWNAVIHTYFAPASGYTHSFYTA